jgi:hypothetical protein
MAEYDFSGLAVGELTTLRASALAGLNAVLNVGQSYSMMGRSFSKVNAGELSKIIAAITQAIDAKSGESATSRLGYVNVDF